MASKDRKVVSVSTIPEVQHFVETQRRYEEFKARNPALMEELSAIAEEYNVALEAAAKATKAKDVTCGPFDRYQVQTKYHAERLYEELGKEEFFKYGGSIKQTTEYVIDKAIFEAKVAAGNIPEEVVETVKEISPRYRKVPEISIP